MKVFWYQGGLHFEPQGPFDMAKLKAMARDYSVKASAHISSDSGEHAGSSAEDLFARVIEETGSDFQS